MSFRTSLQASVARRIVGIACAVAVAGVEARAGAQDQRAVATALFDQGRQLLQEKRYADACPKFEESARLVRSPGTLLNLADCYEHLGRVASAWAQFREAAAEAGRVGRALEEREARRRADVLAPSVAHISVRVWPDVVEPEVRCDGITLDRAAWTDIPLDAGDHELTVRAPDRVPWSHAFHLENGQTLELAAPLLAPAPRPSEKPLPPVAVAPPPAPRRVAKDTTPPRAPTHSSTRHTFGIALGGVGLLGVGAGTAFGWSARALWRDEQSACRTVNQCDSSPARTAGNLSTIAFTVGLAALASGVYLMLDSPSNR